MTTTKKPSKITIEHYLNKDLKPIIRDRQKAYRIYIKIIIKGKTYRIKSDIFSNSNLIYATDKSIKTELYKYPLQAEKDNLYNGLIKIENINLLTSKNIKLTKISLFDILYDFYPTIFEIEANKIDFDISSISTLDLFEIKYLFNRLGSNITDEFSYKYTLLELLFEDLTLLTSQIKKLDITAFEYLYTNKRNVALELFRDFVGNEMQINELTEVIDDIIISQKYEIE